MSNPTVLVSYLEVVGAALLAEGEKAATDDRSVVSVIAEYFIVGNVL